MTKPISNLPLYKDIANMIDKVGPMTHSEVMSIFPSIDKKSMSDMSHDGYVRLEERPDGARAYILTFMGRRLTNRQVIATKATAPNTTMFGYGQPYRAPEMARSVRPGANDHEAFPSRQGSILTYRDGRTESL